MRHLWKKLSFFCERPRARLTFWCMACRLSQTSFGSSLTYCKKLLQYKFSEIMHLELYIETWNMPNLAFLHFFWQKSGISQYLRRNRRFRRKFTFFNLMFASRNSLYLPNTCLESLGFLLCWQRKMNVTGEKGNAVHEAQMWSRLAILSRFSGDRWGVWDLSRILKPV